MQPRLQAALLLANHAGNVPAIVPSEMVCVILVCLAPVFAARVRCAPLQSWRLVAHGSRYHVHAAMSSFCC